ncbi:cellulose binding domain-containing protein [Streptomyces roseirectus]|uniref:Cellulose binding domain-containing protein n=1 Tax=Streptomyces roseirectus TaxID=2768066 RepID=A0A7H0IQS4_9ACTN|nr:cellulose binding domain-containing protein [Streptomyces roseirectus]QNP75140.1 cellulose binding domain-containing protein [Streptomyces roseirectus]
MRDRQGGFQADITLCDTGTAALTDWTLDFGFPSGQTTGNLWGGTPTQRGADVVHARRDRPHGHLTRARTRNRRVASRGRNAALRPVGTGPVSPGGVCRGRRARSCR